MEAHVYACVQRALHVELSRVLHVSVDMSIAYSLLIDIEDT